MAKKRGSGKAGRRWEEALHCLQLLDFQEVERKSHPLLFERWYMRDVAYTTIYGTRGRHEYMLFNGTQLLTVECKYQDSSGSVDEKMPYIHESWLRSQPYEQQPFSKYWLVAFDGDYWKRGRGLKAVGWLRERCIKHNSTRRSLSVTNGFQDMLAWLKDWA